MKRKTYRKKISKRVKDVPSEQIWSKLNATQKFLRMWREHGLPKSDLRAEHVFTDEADYALDFAFPSLKIGIEIHGFGFGHQRIGGLIRDCRKMRAAIALGWTIIPFTTSCLSSKQSCQDSIEFLTRLLCDVKNPTPRIAKSHRKKRTLKL